MSTPVIHAALNARELAAVLAGLRLLQHHTNLATGIQEILADAGEIISSDGIDALCERLNIDAAVQDDARVMSAAAALLAVAEEIADDSRVDLVDSERRIRLYAAIAKTRGEIR